MRSHKGNHKVIRPIYKAGELYTWGYADIASCKTLNEIRHFNISLNKALKMPMLTEKDFE